MIRISAVVPTFNEEQNIGACIRSLAWCDEIVVVDKCSTDRTVELARDAGAVTFLYRCDKPSHEKQRLFGIEHAQGEWILCLDADERVTPELANEISRVTANAGPMVGFYVPFHHFFFGKYISHGSPKSAGLLRLIKKNGASYPAGGRVHEQLHPNGPAGKLKNCIEHFGTRDLTHYLEKNNIYTSMSAEKMFAEGRRVTWRNGFLVFIVKPLYYFLKSYVVHGAWRDGAEGTILAVLTGYTVLINHFKLWELQKKAVSPRFPIRDLS